MPQYCNIKKKKGYKTLLILLLPVFLFSKTLITPLNPAKGEPVLILDTNKPLYAEMFGKKFYFHPTFKNRNFSSFALIPVSYYKKPKSYTLTIHYKNSFKKYTIYVDEGTYKKEEIKVAKKYVSPPKKVIKRIKKEYKEAMKIYNTYTKKRLWHSYFSLPLHSKITSMFGSARMFNGKLKSYHTGIDFKAKTATPVKAVSDGVVVLAKKRYFAGGSVIVSHGLGIYSCYYHLSKINAKKGQKVSKGTIIGLSGKSGRVTGPHLHFTMWLDGVIVNPQKLVKLLNEI